MSARWRQAALLALLIAAPAAAQSSAEHFAIGRELIENNCIDCQGGTQAGMEDGLREIEAALAQGLPDRIPALKLLADGYTAMITYSERDAAKADRFGAKAGALRAELYRLDPNDPEIVQNYADSLPQSPDKLLVLRRLVALDPHRWGALYQLGLLTLGEAGEGWALMRQAISGEEDPESIVTYVQGMLQALGDHGCAVPGEAELQNALLSASDAATSGAGDPAALPQFKARLWRALDAQKCTPH
jgi:hypothetical protein